MDPGQLYRALESSRPMAARLAVLSSLPVRVSPALLRLVRVRVLPQSGTGDEADLWLSDLIESRSAGAFAFRPAVRAYLRERLRGDAGLLDDVWHRVHVEHQRWIPARARLEEELTWRLLRQRDDPVIETLWAGVVQELDTGPNAEGVARWVVRAMSDLPEGTLDHASGRRAYYGSHLLLGDASVLGHEPQQFLASGEFSFATRRLPRRRIFVGLTDSGLLVSPLRQIEHGHDLDIPATQPLWIQLEQQTGVWAPAQQTVVTIEDNEPATVTTGTDAVTLRTIDGAAYAISRLRSGQHFIRRNRAPRVQIEYEVELYGAAKMIQLPFVTGVLADLSGTRREPLPPVEDRKFLDIDRDNFDSRMKALQPRAAFTVANELADGVLRVDLTFETMDDFSPAGVARQVEPLNTLLETRHQLSNLITYMDGKSEAEDLLNRLLRDTRMLRALTLRTSADDEAVREGEATIEQVAEFEARFEKAFSPRTDETRRSIERATRTLAGEALSGSWPKGKDVERFIQTVITEHDKKLSAQVNAILHHEAFQQLEGAWRGLYYLVGNTETSEMLKIRVLNVSKLELREALQGDEGAWDQGAIFRRVYESEYGQFGGEPFGCLIGDYYFDHTLEDVELLGRMSKVCSASHSPFIAGAAPTVMQMASWQELADRRDLSAIFTTDEYAGWRALRESDEAKYLALAMPRFLARLPYGARTWPVEEFSFEEDATNDNGRYTWSNAAYAMAVTINRAFAAYGWCARIRGIESGGAVEGLPTHTFVADDGSTAFKCPTEIAIGDRTEMDLSKSGFLPLVHRRNSDMAVFLSAQSLQQPLIHEDPDATASARLAAQLPYLFPCCRFAHYLKCIVRDSIGKFNERSDLEGYLDQWIHSYITLDLDASEAVKARYPLAAAAVQLEEGPDRLGYYQATVSLRPHYQLEDVYASLQLVTRLPSVKSG